MVFWSAAAAVVAPAPNNTILTTANHAFGPPSLNFKSFMSGLVSNLEGLLDVVLFGIVVVVGLLC